MPIGSIAPSRDHKTQPAEHIWCINMDKVFVLGHRIKPPQSAASKQRVTVTSCFGPAVIESAVTRPRSTFIMAINSLAVVAQIP